MSECPKLDRKVPITETACGTCSNLKPSANPELSHYCRKKGWTHKKGELIRMDFGMKCHDKEPTCNEP
jgi:hypothetical protein